MGSLNNYFIRSNESFLKQHFLSYKDYITAVLILLGGFTFSAY